MSDSDYDVEQYIKPTVKRSTYENNDDYLSENSENSDADIKSNESEEIEDITEKQLTEEIDKGKSQCTLNKNPPHKNNKIKNAKPVEEPIRTNSRLIIYVSNLTSETTRTMIEDFFRDAGAIKSVRIPKKRLSNFAFVEMLDMEGYKNGLKFDGRELDGRRIKVQQGSKNKKHITNKTRLLKKKRMQIFEKKFQNRIKNE